MADIAMRLGSDVLVVQGPMGTQLMARGFDAETPLDLLNLTEPEEVAELHVRYRAGGADCGLTNTFGASRARLAAHGLERLVRDINLEGARLARDAGFTHLLGCIGPCGEQDARRAADDYAEQAGYLAEGGVEAFLLETFVSLDDAVAAVEAVRRAVGLPVLACMAFAPGGVDPAEAAGLLEKAGAAAVGCNCMPIQRTVETVALMRASCALPIVALPSAGAGATGDDGAPTRPDGPDEFARAGIDLLRAGARVVGSCCGSTPACTGALFATVGGVVFPEQ